MLSSDQWVWSIEHQQACRIVEAQDLWGEKTCRGERIPENVLQEDPKLLIWYDQAMTRMGEE